MSDKAAVLAVGVLLALVNELAAGDVRLLLLGVGFVALLGVLAIERSR